MNGVFLRSAVFLCLVAKPDQAPGQAQTISFIGEKLLRCRGQGPCSAIAARCAGRTISLVPCKAVVADKVDRQRTIILSRITFATMEAAAIERLVASPLMTDWPIPAHGKGTSRPSNRAASAVTGSAATDNGHRFKAGLQNIDLINAPRLMPSAKETATADRRISSNSKLAAFRVSFFESFNPAGMLSGSRITAAATTGPARGPARFIDPRHMHSPRRCNRFSNSKCGAVVCLRHPEGTAQKKGKRIGAGHGGHAAILPEHRFSSSPVLSSRQFPEGQELGNSGKQIISERDRDIGVRNRPERGKASGMCGTRQPVDFAPYCGEEFVNCLQNSANCFSAPSGASNRSVLSDKAALVEAAALGSHFKPTADLDRIRPLAAHALAPFGIIILAAAHGAQHIDHMAVAVRIMLQQPVAKQRADLRGRRNRI